MRVLCIKWGDKYSAQWVTRLQSMVAKHLSVEHEFICITENPVEGVKCIPLVCDLPHWWQKVGLVQPDFFDGWNLYLDLDIVITASIDPIIQAAKMDETKLWMRDDFSYSLRNPKQGMNEHQIEMLGGHGTCNSSVMVWRGDAARQAWDEFTPDVMKRQHGDQNWFTKVLYPKKIGFIPDETVGSYKYGKLRNEPIAPVMVFHGDPKMDALPKDDGLRKLWEAA